MDEYLRVPDENELRTVKVKEKADGNFDVSFSALFVARDFNRMLRALRQTQKLSRREFLRKKNLEKQLKEEGDAKNARAESEERRVDPERDGVAESIESSDRTAAEREGSTRVDPERPRDDENNSGEEQRPGDRGGPEERKARIQSALRKKAERKRQ